MSDKIKKHVWPDDIRLEMIKKSEFYQEPRIYQYGYYDGYQKHLNDSKAPELLNQLTKLFNAIDSCIDLTPELLIETKQLIKEATTL